MRRDLQLYMFMNLRLHQRNEDRFPAPTRASLSLTAFPLARPPTSTGFPPSPAPPPLILWTHCDPRAPGPASLLPPVLHGWGWDRVRESSGHLGTCRRTWSPGPTSQPHARSSRRSLPLPVPSSARSSSKGPLWARGRSWGSVNPVHTGSW